MSQEAKRKTALVMLMEGVEELEAVAPIDCLRRAEVEVITAAVGDRLEVRGRNGITLLADSLFEKVSERAFDLIVLPGGPGHAALRTHSGLRRLLQHQAAAGRLLGSICAGPLVLSDAGLLQGRRFTSFPATAGELPERIRDQAVVRDGNLITSQGAGTAILFSIQLVSALCGEVAAREVADSICHPG